MARRQDELFSLQYYASLCFPSKETVIERPEEEDISYDILIEETETDTIRMNRYWKIDEISYLIFVWGDDRDQLSEDLDALNFFIAQGELFNSQHKIPVWALADWEATPEPDVDNDIPTSWMTVSDYSSSIIPSEHPGKYIGVVKMTASVKRVIWNFGNPLITQVESETEIE